MYRLAVFSALLALIGTGEATKCYVCTSAIDPKCGDPFTKSDDGPRPIECTPSIVNDAANTFNKLSRGIASTFGIDQSKAPTVDTNFVCSKVSYTQNDRKTVVRSCAPSKDDFCSKMVEQGKDANFGAVECNVCSSDDCNGAGALNAALFVLIPALALLVANR